MARKPLERERIAPGANDRDWAIIRCLLAGDLPSRKIAELAMCSVRWVDEVSERFGLGLYDFASTKPYRCPKCGHKVKRRPCVVCRARASRDIAKRTRGAAYQHTDTERTIEA